MKRILTLLLFMSVIIGTALPLTALAAGTEAAPFADSGESTVTDNGEDDFCIATPTDAMSEESAGVAPLSGWTDVDSEFYTRVRLTVTDRSGNPIEGAVYGLYRRDGTLLQWLTTNSFGIANSGDVPVDTDYYLLEYITPEGYQPNPDRRDILLSEICSPLRVDVYVEYDPISGDIKIIKTGEDGEPLAGVGFYVYRNSDCALVDTVYTDQNGEAYSRDLCYGWYDLYEFDTPPGFAGGGYTSVFMDDGNESTEVYITNYRARGYVRVYNAGNDGCDIAGAVFSIYRADGEWIEDITTSNGGYADSSGLLLGDYYVIEKSVPSPYELDASEHYFTISYSGEYPCLYVVNNRNGFPGKLKIIETDDSATPVPLSGVTFGLYRAWDGSKLGELTTGADGTVTSGDLIPDNYYIVELYGKTGYEMEQGQMPITIDGTGATIEKTVVNPKTRLFGKVKVIKTDDAGNPISGARFGVYCYRDNLLAELVTGADGTATSGVLNEGSGYYLKELEGAPGYVPDTDTKHTFDITENNVTVPVSVINPRITGGVKVIKTGDNGDYPILGVEFGVFRAGTDDKVYHLTTGSDGTATSGALFYGDYELRELSTVYGYERIDTPIPFSISEQGVVVQIAVSNPYISGTVRVRKLDRLIVPLSGGSNDNLLSGAVFALYNEWGQMIGELTTGSDGAGEYHDLPQGHYYLKELVAPEGYMLMDELLPFEIHAPNQIVVVNAPNARGDGVLEVVKHGDNELLSGVTFEVYRESTNEKVDEITTGANGTATVTLPLGRYYLKETVTVEGYRLPTSTVSFSLTADGAKIELSIENQKTCAPENGTIRITKKDETSGALLSGAVFEVYRASDDVLAAKITTGSDGAATSPALPEGDYYLLEFTAPKGYEFSTIKTPVSVKAGQTAEVTITNKVTDVPTIGYVRLIKTADGTGKKLPGAVFGLYRSANDEKVADLTTDSDGTTTSPEVPEGEYYLKEIKAPSAFRLSPDKIAVHVKAGETIEITTRNYPEDVAPPTAKVKITKESDIGEKLKDAVFGIYRAANDEKVAELTTGSDGAALSPSLPAGDYYYKELKAPDGYKPITEKVTFTLKDNETKELTIRNEKLSDSAIGTLLIVKKAEKTGRPLPDAVFGVYTASGNAKVAELTTSDDGTAVMALAPGDYYLKELKAPVSYVPEQDKIPFRIKTGTQVNVEVTNTQGRGTLRLLKTGAEGEPVAGAVFALCKQDGTQLAELRSGKDGAVSYDLPIGAYYIEEKAAAVGYRLDARRYGFDVENGRTTDVRIVNERIQGTVEAYFRDVADNRELAPMKSYTDKVGTDYVKWLRQNGYENMSISDYTLIRTDYPSSFVLIDGVLTVTLWYDSGKTLGGIAIPKTGETPPITLYMLSLLCWSIAAFCALSLFRERQPAAQVDAAGIACVEIPPEPTVKTQADRAIIATQPAKAHSNKSKRRKGRR